jgi:hypothetical protein
MSIEEHLAHDLAAAREQANMSWDPTRDLAAAAAGRVRRRRRFLMITSGVATTFTIGGAIAFAVVSSDGGTQDRVTLSPAKTQTPASPAARQVDLQVGYLPPGFSYLHAQHGPTNVFVDLTRVYQRDAGAIPSTLLVTAQYGQVTSVSEYRKDNGPLRDTTVGGRPAVVGWNTGTPGQGLHLLYVVLSSSTAVEVIDQPGPSAQALADEQLVQVAQSVKLTTTGPPYTEVSVPDVVGDSQAAATDAIRAAGLAAGSAEYDYSGKANVPPEHVMRQEPAAGSVVTSGSLVNFVLAPSN